jgi:hypothetical protein
VKLNSIVVLVQQFNGMQKEAEMAKFETISRNLSDVD